MGGSGWSPDDYKARDAYRKAADIPVFSYSADIAAGRAKREVHASFNPLGVALRESRDSNEHPVTVPVAILLDVTGSMARVPEMIEAKLPSLMGHFLEDKASGKKYLGDGYPAIMISAVDDYRAVGTACLQIGQFESGMEIDKMLENLWLTGNGGGTYEESYELGAYFMARHTVHDHMEKRGRKGYLFIIGDEHAYNFAYRDQIKTIIGDDVQDDVPFETVLQEAQELYHVFFVIPNMTNHYRDPELYKWWVDRLSQQHVLRLEDPNKVCELIVTAVAICEQHAGWDDIVADGVADGAWSTALVPLADAVPASRSASALALPDIPSPGLAASGIERL